MCPKYVQYLKEIEKILRIHKSDINSTKNYWMGRMDGERRLHC